MNRGKRGRPFSFPESLVAFATRLKMVLKLPFRQLQGFLEGLGSFLGIRVPDYTTLWHRLGQSEVRLPEPDLSGTDWTVAIDSTGIKVTDRGEWMRERWHVHRGWIKVHMAVEVRSRVIVGIRVGGEDAGDAQFLPNLVEQASRLLHGRISGVLADGGYDTFENFDYLDKRDIEPAILTRKNASSRSRGHSFVRPRAVRERCLLGEEEWKRKYGYNIRWKSETMFSAVKRRMGESVRSKRPDLAMGKARMMFVQYSLIRREAA